MVGEVHHRLPEVALQPRGKETGGVDVSHLLGSATDKANSRVPDPDVLQARREKKGGRGALRACMHARSHLYNRGSIRSGRAGRSTTIYGDTSQNT